MDILPFIFFGSLFRCREVSSTTFCTVVKTLHLHYPFSGVHLGTLPLESKRQIYKPSSIYQFLASMIASYGLLQSVILRTASLLLLGDNSNLFRRV